MQNSNFIHETEVYRLLNNKGVSVPDHAVIRNEADIKSLPFNDGEPLVVKGLAYDLWHKSDEGALHFIDYSEAELLKIHEKIRSNLADRFEFIETLVCRKAAFKQSGQLPSEAFVSLQKDESCGHIIHFGIGGIHTEAWATLLNSGIMMWPASLMTPEDALEEIKNHMIGKVWLGTLRQGEALTTEDKISGFLKSLWNVVEDLEDNRINLLEMNPVVLSADGTPMALDGVGTYYEGADDIPEQPGFNAQAVLNPQTIAISGVSDKPGSFGTKILDNLIKSDIPNDKLKVIKPKVDEFKGIACYPDVAGLKDTPVDALIIALPAKITVNMLIELCHQGGGADVVYLVAGGLGDGADKEGLAKQVTDLLNSRRQQGLWTPAIIGPNSLGIVLAPQHVSTLFISERKLPISFQEKGNIGFISQSGAFLISRLSNNPTLPIKYGLCIGNQMDKKASDLMEALASDDDISVIGVYIEGFSEGDTVKFALEAKKVIESGKKVILYKGGRSSEGMKAAAGHTGAMAGNYQLQKSVLEKAGVIITEAFDEFATTLKWYSAYPTYRKPEKLAVMSNAGYETVGSADRAGEDLTLGRQNLLMPLQEDERTILEGVIADNRLNGLVSAGNPLDLTPMAGEKAYLDATACFAESRADTVVVCLVPLTDMLRTFQNDKVASFAEALKQIADTTGKAIGVVVDSGFLYDEYRKIIESTGIPVFRSIEEIFKPITKAT